MKEKLTEFFASLDRSQFIDNQYRVLSSLDRPLPIGHGQTISQPSLVVYMIEQSFYKNFLLCILAGIKACFTKSI
ncbi:MAG: hypothetical protein WC233_07630 [Sphaerochaeta sp.]|jgi:protein-L-isoaspartate(D-aspartate) O-methyltransferase